MGSISNRNFGLLIAYVLPGFVAMWGMSFVLPTVAHWLSVTAECEAMPTVAGFLNLTVAAIAAGMGISAIRFVVIDRIHHVTGLKRPVWDDSKLQDNLSALESLIENHYRYYQFHANMIVAMAVAYGARLSEVQHFSGPVDLAFIISIAIFWITSRDNLTKYYTRIRLLFGE